MAQYLSEEVAIQIAITPADGVAATTDINGTIVDTAGYDGVLALVTFGVITANAVTSVKWQQDTAVAMGGAADLLQSGVAVLDTDDNKTFYIDLGKPRERYVRIVVDRGTQNAVVSSATYLLYRARRFPVTHGTNVSGEQWTYPAEGNAIISSVSPSASLSPSASASPSASVSPTPSASVSPSASASPSS